MGEISNVITMGQSTSQGNAMDNGKSIMNIISNHRNYTLSTNALGNMVTIDFNRNASRWAYGESDVEIGFTQDGSISYFSIEFKNGLSNMDMDRIKKAVICEKPLY
ncbi:MAG: hypothetical protein ACYCSO_06195 [Cuniculiplasma sp.]